MYANTVARRGISKMNASPRLKKNRKNIGKIMRRSGMSDIRRINPNRMKGHPIKMLIYSMTVKIYVIRCVY